MEKKVIATDKAPAAIGPYSQGIQVGNLVFFSGQIPLVPETGAVVSGGIAEQTEQVMANMGAALAAAGLDYRHVVKTTIYLADMNDFPVVNDIYGRYFPDSPPARATVEVARLPKDVAVEI
ncbi:MAG: reactive intermediate/imine deaminase, partial [Deltaproteobacteria bacterium]